jgi:small GTP-binding protein
MTTIDDILEEFPEPVQDVVGQVWEDLSPGQREEFGTLLGQLPVSLKPLKEVVSLVVNQYKPVFGTKRTIAIVGPANVGKSTLYNQLIAQQKDRAEVGPVPGTTRQNQEADSGLFALVDTPGADAVGEVGERERRIAFDAAQRADFLVIVFEATQGIKRYQKDLFDSLVALDKPFVVVLNKVDLIPKRDRERVHNAAAQNLRLEPSQVIETVATAGTNVGRVILAVAKFEPQLLAALGACLPEYRTRLAWQRIVPAAGGAGVIGLMPLPIVDLIPLVGIQSGLVLSIARIYGFKISLRRAKELIATFGIGMIARTIFQQVAKLGGVPGWILSASIAAATTVGIGYAAVGWFGRGERPTRKTLQKTVADVTAYLKDQLMGLGEKKPDRGTLRERITQALSNLPHQLRPNPPAQSTSSSPPEDGESVPASSSPPQGGGAVTAYPRSPSEDDTNPGSGTGT